MEKNKHNIKELREIIKESREDITLIVGLKCNLKSYFKTIIHNLLLNAEDNNIQEDISFNMNTQNGIKINISQYALYYELRGLFIHSWGYYLPFIQHILRDYVNVDLSLIFKNKEDFYYNLSLDKDKIGILAEKIKCECGGG